MKEVKAYVHRFRAADVIEAIKATKAWTMHRNVGEQPHLAVTAVQGTLAPLDAGERHYSVELGLEVVNEFRLELHCDDHLVDEVVDAIRSAGGTGRRGAGCVLVADIVAVHPIP